jgi:outer membrane protein TolC
MIGKTLQKLPCLLLILATLAGSNTFATAQEPGQPYDPPVMRFEPSGISLLEAVQMTLENDPNIKLQEAGVSYQEGVARQFKGEFDVHLLFDANYQYREQELRESRKEIERETRAQRDEAITEGEKFEEDAQELLDALEQASDGGPTSAIPDPVIQSQLVLLDVLIDQNVNDPAAQAELIALREEIIDQGIVATTDALNDSIDLLEENRRIRAQLGDVPNDEFFYEGGFALDFTKTFRSGFVIDPYFEMDWDGENFKGKDSKDVEFGGKGIEDLYVFKVGFDVVIPLLRNRGRDATAAGEQAALVEIDAKRAALQHQSAASVLRTVVAYWDLRSAQDAVAVAQRSVGLQERLVAATQQLINAGDLAQAELARVQASQARSRARLEDSRRDLHQARVNLATAMGIAVTNDEETRPLAADSFPAPQSAELLNEQTIDALAGAATDLRRDLLALRTLEQAGRVLERGARLDLKPLLDVNAGIWGTALGETELSEAVDRWVGPSFSVGVRYEQPFGNNFFGGRHAQSVADLRQRMISATDLERGITLGVIRDAQSLRDAIRSVEQAQISADAYRRSVDSEMQRFDGGDASLIDTILTEDQQTFALYDLVSAQRTYAQLLARLRFESGRLISYDSGQSQVAQDDLTTLPTGGQQ